MDFRDLIQSLDTINEDSKVHKGTYGNKHGKEDVRDQYGHKIGKIDKDADDKDSKEAPKKGRGRPKKGSDDSGEVKKYDTKSLGDVFGGGKKPNKEVGKKSVKHSLKDWIEDVAQGKDALNESGPGAVSTMGTNTSGGSISSTGTNNSAGQDPQMMKQVDNVVKGLKNKVHLPVSDINKVEKGIATTMSGQKMDGATMKATGGLGAELLDVISKSANPNEILNPIAKASQQQMQAQQMQANQTQNSPVQPMHEEDEMDEGELSFMEDDTEHEGHDPSEYGMEGDFVKTQLHTIARVTQHLEKELSDTEDLPEWAEEKVSQAKGMMVSVMDYITSEKERDHEAETGEEGYISEKAVSKAQQKFFGMVHAMQKGKKVPGASKELKGVAKDISKKDATDFAKTKHKGLPQHVKKTNETSFEDQGVMENYNPVKEVKHSAIEYMKSTGIRNVHDLDAEAIQYIGDENQINYEEVCKILGCKLPEELGPVHSDDLDESGLQAYLGNKKYGKDGMDALRKAGQEHAGEKKMQNIRAKYSKKEEPMDEGRDEGKPGKNFAKIAKSAGKRYGSKAAGERVAGAVRAKLAKQGKLEESTSMKKLTEGAMKDILTNFYDEVESHKGDGSIFDIKKARNVQQVEEVLTALVKHGDEYSSLDVANQNEIVMQTLKYLAHQKELPFNTMSTSTSSRFAQQPKSSSFAPQHTATPSKVFNKPETTSSGFLSSLRKPATFNEGNDMKDKQFESWERELNSLLNEGITVSHSTGQQGSPDSLSINATEHDATELMNILRNSGMEMFGGTKDQQVDGYGAPQAGEEGGEEFHQGVEIAPSPEVVGDGDDMLALIKKMSGIGSDANTPDSVEVDYEPEGGEDEHSNEEDKEETDEGAGVMHFKDEQAKKAGKDSFKLGGKTFPVKEDDMEEGAGVMHYKKEQAEKAGEDHFKLGGKDYPVKEDEMEEGAEDCMECGYPMMECQCDEHDHEGHDHMNESSEDCMECGMPMMECECDQIEEGFANDAGGDAMGDTELMQLKELLAMGNDMHRVKRDNTVGNPTKVAFESQIHDWKKLSGIK